MADQSYFDDGYDYDVYADNGRIVGTGDPNNTDLYAYDYGYDYNDTEYKDYGNVYFYESFSFEKAVYLYVWAIFIILTTLANILVILVLMRKRMRNATNVILIAIAVSDSLTGLLTLPPYIYAYGHYHEIDNGTGMVAISKGWCEAFMLIKYFVSRAFHTISIWLTVTLGAQRFVSVYLPFRANSLFSIKKTLVVIAIVCVLSPLLHVYHLKDKKATKHNECYWKLDECNAGGCVYLWISALLMHLFPCILLIVLSVSMIVVMNHATRNLKRSQMISNAQKLHKRDLESRRISFVVIAVVIVFLIPEVPYGIFLLINVSLAHAGKALIVLKTNRQIICAYEILVVLSFNANFWIYLAMNRRFRRGLTGLLESLLLLVFSLLSKVGVRYHYQRRFSESSTETAKPPQTETCVTSALTRTNSGAKDVMLQRSASRTSSAGLEMKTYRFDQEKKQ